jgi:CBS domain-containing protein
VAAARTVGHIMSTPVVTARPAETIAAVAGRMREHKVGSVVVVDHDRRAIGILTERDMLRLAGAGSDACAAKVSEWMTADPDTVASAVDASDAFASLAAHGYRHIPVVDGGKLVGIVSMRDLMRVAMIQPVEAQAHEIPKGLEGVVVADTTVGDVRGLEGFYHYRQYSAVDLARARPLEDVWHLLFEGRLPATLAEREAFTAEIRRWRSIPPAVADVLPAIARAGETFVPLDALRTAVSHYGAALGFRPSHDVDAATLRDNAMATCAVVPTLICALWRLRNGQAPVEPDPSGELPLHDARSGAAGRVRGRGREVPHLHDRPRIQRVDVHRAGDHLDRRRPRRGGRGRDRRALGPAPRRSPQPRPADARRDRDRRPGRSVAA